MSGSGPKWPQIRQGGRGPKHLVHKSGPKPKVRQWGLPSLLRLGCSSTRWWAQRKKVAETNVQGTDVKASGGWRKCAVRSRLAGLSHARLLPPPARARTARQQQQQRAEEKQRWRLGRWFGDQYSEETRLHTARFL
jgi:hypothetical protein